MGERLTNIDTISTEMEGAGIDSTVQSPSANEQRLLADEIKYITDDEEKAQAQYYLSYYKRWKALSKTNTDGYLQIYGLYSNFFNSLSEQDQERVRNSKIFHLFSGSSLDNQWKNIPLTDEGGLFIDFIKTKIIPLIEGYEEG